MYTEDFLYVVHRFMYIGLCTSVYVHRFMYIGLVLLAWSIALAGAKDIDALYSELDVDGNGQITIKELKAFLNGKSKNKQKLSDIMSKAGAATPEEFKNSKSCTYEKGTDAK